MEGMPPEVFTSLLRAILLTLMAMFCLQAGLRGWAWMAFAGSVAFFGLSALIQLAHNVRG